MGTVPAFDPRRAAERIARYRRDYRAFVQEQLKIQGKPFRFWPCQLPLVENIEKQLKRRGYARCVWLKARQTGSSTLAETFVAWRTMLWPHVNALVVADEAERARTLFDISRGFYDNLDDDIRPVGRYITKRELVFENPSHATRARDPGLQSRITIDSAAKKAIAIGARRDVIHLSECSRFPDPAFVIDGVIPALHMVEGTIAIFESSAEMAGTWFRQFCDDSMRGLTGFEFMFVPFFQQPEYQLPLVRGERMDFTADERHLMAEFLLTPAHIKWMRAKLAEMGNDWDLFRQSFPLTPEDSWVTPGAQVFSTKIIKEQRGYICPPKRRADVFPGPRILDSPQGRLSVWEEPEPNCAYDIACDVSVGIAEEDDTDRDLSVACVLKRKTNVQVAEWASRAVDAFELATILYWLGTYYNTAQIAVEVNGIGGGTNQQLTKMGYRNPYVWRFRDELVSRYSKKTGWETNQRSKAWLVGFMTHELANHRAQVRSELLLKEMEVFVQKGVNEWGAIAGKHDDRVMAFGIALLTSDDESFEKYYGLRRDVAAAAVTSAPMQKMLPESWECDSTFLKPKRIVEYAPWD